MLCPSLKAGGGWEGAERKAAFVLNDTKGAEDETYNDTLCILGALCGKPHYSATAAATALPTAAVL